MIIDLQKTTDYIVTWLKDYMTQAGLQTWVVGLSGGVDSALVALLCKRTSIPTLCVSMPCHSSPETTRRAEAFAKEYDLPLFKVDLSEAHNSIISGITFYTDWSDCNVFQNHVKSDNKKMAEAGLRSCLRAPVLSFFANSHKGLIVGTGNRSEDHLTRYFQKYGDGCVDLSPIADLFKQEVYELFAYLSQEMKKGGLFSIDAPVYSRGVNISYIPQAAKTIFEAQPTADLWGENSGQTDEGELGLTYEEIEWADRENMKNKIVESSADPAKNAEWQRFTGRQREVISKMHALEKISRHKYNPNVPVCHLRYRGDLVR